VPISLFSEVLLGLVSSVPKSIPCELLFTVGSGIFASNVGSISGRVVGATVGVCVASCGIVGAVVSFLLQAHTLKAKRTVMAIKAIFFIKFTSNFQVANIL
jgi:hypothetical protein